MNRLKAYNTRPLEGTYIFIGPHLFPFTIENGNKVCGDYFETPPGTIATNVIRVVTEQHPDGDDVFFFNIQGKEGFYSSNYAWAFIKNTLDNVKLYNDYLEKRVQEEAIAKEARTLFDKLEKLTSCRQHTNNSQEFDS